MNTKGFTIVETLIAITILMISISGPLVVASKGSAGATAAKDQMIASYLAQESMDTIKNLRDNNIAQGFSWLTGFSVGSVCNGVSKPCDASAIDATPILTTGTAAYPLYLQPEGYYSHNASGGTPTLFSRSFYLTAPGTANPCLEASNECTATVAVAWNEGITSYQVSISSEILNTAR